MECQARSLRLDARELDHLGPFLGFGCNESAKVGGTKNHWDGADIAEPRPDVRRSQPGKRFGQQFIIENRPGAATNIATEVAVRAPGDGYTLLLASPANAINATLYEKLNFNFIRDIAPVASLVRLPFVMVVNPSLPTKTGPEFVAYAKANPGRISMASAGVGSGPHVSGELFKMMAGVDMLHVPYRGDAPRDLLWQSHRAAYQCRPRARPRARFEPC